jgi:hypothetical protein
LHLYFQKYIIMKEMKRIQNGDDPNSNCGNCIFNLALVFQNPFQLGVPI